MLATPTAVWMTGVGTISPLGHGYGTVAERLLAGRSGVVRVRHFDVSQHPSQVAGPVSTVPCPLGAAPAAFASLPRLEQFTRYCCTEALRDAGWWPVPRDLRVGLVLGLGAEWLETWEADALAGGRRVWEAPGGEKGLLARTMLALGLNGPSSAVSTACASGNVALALARQWLRLGWVDVCLAGACDAGVEPVSLAGFGNLRALTRRNGDPEGASRPFDRERDGFVISEGGAVFVLERAETARHRGAEVYAEVAGYGASSDAHHMVIPSPDAGPAIAAVRAALADASVRPDEVDYVNAHATSTPVGDVAEARVLAAALGEEVRRVPVSATKSMTGHLLTAASAFEAVACVVAMRHGAIPPTINLDDPDPECDLHHVAHQALERRVRVAVSNSFGFGGSNTCLVLRVV